MYQGVPCVPAGWDGHCRHWTVSRCTSGGRTRFARPVCVLLYQMEPLNWAATADTRQTPSARVTLSDFKKGISVFMLLGETVHMFIFRQSHDNVTAERTDILSYSCHTLVWYSSVHRQKFSQNPQVLFKIHECNCVCLRYVYESYVNF